MIRRNQQIQLKQSLPGSIPSKKELNRGNEAYKEQYAIAYEKWEAIPNHKKAFNPEKYFILVAIKERLYNLLKELAKLEEILPEG